MILQPIVENAVQHGIHEALEKGKITLSVDMVEAEDNETGEDCVRIIVADNGVGMTREQLEKIMSGGRERTDGADVSSGEAPESRPSEEAPAVEAAPAAETSPGSTGIAMGNVISRLELYYGKPNLFTIWSDGPGCGTEVTVLLPCGKQVKEDSEWIRH